MGNYMEKFYLTLPSLERKKEIVEFLDEFVEHNSDLNGSGALAKIFEGFTFEEALDRCLNMEDEEYANSLGRCPSKTFLLIRENDKKIVGVINIRWNLTDEMGRFATNIGYSIRPTMRRKGYNKINLYLGIIEAKKLGLSKVMLDCDATNIGSYKTMEALGGKLELKEIDPYDGVLTCLYSFDVLDTIEKYKDTYSDKIIIQ